MPRRFPGMDPYLEAPHLWSDLHASIIPAIRRHLRKLLPPRYRVKLDERIYVDTTEGEETFRPDLSVSARSAPEGAPAAGGKPHWEGPSAGAVLIRTAILEERREVFLEVREHPSGELVTVIEVLSPANKRPGSEGRALYLRKRNAVLRSPAHLLEIDLLRSGAGVPMAEPLPPAPYLAIVSRASTRPVCEVYPIGYGDPLPSVPVPLKAPDSDARIDLESSLDEVYAEAGYDTMIDYAAAPPPPVDEGLESLLKRGGVKR